MTPLSDWKLSSEPMKPMYTDWQDGASRITKNFTVYEACWLPSVRSLYYPSYSESQNLIRLCEVLEKIRLIFDKPLIVHVMIRPEWYNSRPDVNGSEKSMHISGLACDFHIRGLTCDLVRDVLRDHAELLGICIENRPGSAWVHVDVGQPRPNGGRFFIP